MFQKTILIQGKLSHDMKALKACEAHDSTLSIGKNMVDKKIRKQEKHKEGKSRILGNTLNRRKTFT